ncbi:3-dehydroquinate synthase [Pikeienuella piscinae]|uniref:3-dehydroquinate synthase n=1 Tax=Pikeienuella piscinae TaxID=2748098 RepID=A0A7M3T5F5_9RHOB|nr:3-dehydroquinate synthase [Pikeienuella piscinae]QIE57236.1 3-dehydroquinate synthase [Pikeienuella piscinae]
MSAQTSTETLRVALGARAYDIRIGPGLIARAGAEVAPHLARKRVAVVTDETVATLHLDALRAGLADAGVTAEPIVLPPGEATKSMSGFERLLSALLDLKIARDDIILAFGGGVIGDLAGFAAATLRRGVGFIQIPTTLLAQVDSSVGGKTGINAPQGKNLIGAFHQPRLVLADTDALSTLSKREFLAGYAETVKYGLLGDAAFFERLEHDGPALAAGDEAARIAAIRRACEMKAAIVARDETETGERALLNLGHTFGHALEAATGYSQRVLHGEGVSIGVALAFELSMRLGLCPQEEPSRVRAHFREMGLKTALADIDGDLPGADDLIELMGQDKKVKDGRLVFILARAIGDAFIAPEVPMAAVKAVLTDALAERR